MGGSLLSDPSSKTDQKLLDMMKREGYELKYRFDHPLFGPLILGTLKQTNKEKRNVYVRELRAGSEQTGVQIYQYLIRQEQQESPVFPRVFCHLIKPVEV